MKAIEQEMSEREMEDQPSTSSGGPPGLPPHGFWSSARGLSPMEDTVSIERDTETYSSDDE